jgi:hypothetical protein
MAMANEYIDQAEADLDSDATTTATKTVVDPLDSVENTRSDEVSELEKYEEERLAMLADLESAENNEEPEESADEVNDEDEQESADLDPDEDSEQEEEQESESEEEGKPAKASNRFRFSAAEDQAVAAIAKAKGISLVEASRIYAGDAPAAQTSDVAKDQVSQEAKPKTTYDEIQARIEQLEEEELESIRLVDVDRQVEIKQELRKLAKEAEATKASEAKAKQDAQAESNRIWEATAAKATKAYPGLTDPNSAIYKRVQELDAAAQANGDPVFDSPTKLWDYARQAARETGTLMAQTQSPKASTPTGKRPVTSMKPVSGNARTTSADAPQGLAAKIEGLESLDDYERLVGRV